MNKPNHDTHSHQPTLFHLASETADWLEERIDTVPEMALILGSGLGALADELEDPTSLSYEEIPSFPVSGVEGHAGRLVFGELEGRDVVIMQGRVHFYEGWTLDEVVFPVRVFGRMGIDKLVVTNSSGGANPDFEPGNLMLITDHLNMTGDNPLRGENDERFGPRFPDMTDAYDRELRGVVKEVADNLDIDLQEGVYTGVLGPSYETPAEVRMIQTLGGDAIGMSTVPEVIVANHMQMRVVGVSCITNYAAGITGEPLTHEEVKEVAAQVRETFGTLITNVVEEL